MEFPTMWYVRSAKPQVSLRICAVWSEPLRLAWIFYDCSATNWTPFGVTKLKRGLHRLTWVYTCQNATLLEITCRGSYFFWKLSFSTGQTSNGPRHSMVCKNFVSITTIFKNAYHTVQQPLPDGKQYVSLLLQEQNIKTNAPDCFNIWKVRALRWFISKK